MSPATLKPEIPMAFDSLPQINLGIAVLVIFALCAGFVLLRGMVRMVIGIIVLGGSAALGWLVWRDAPVWLFEATGKSPAWAAPALAVTTFFACWWMLRRMIGFFVNPGNASGKPSSFGGALIRLVFALVPTSALAVAAAVAFHHSSPAPNAGKSGDTSAMARLSAWLNDTIPREWLESLDPLANRARVELAKAITLQSQAPRATVVDPKTGKPIPRAVIVQYPELQTLAREGKFRALLNHPNLSKALADPRIQKSLAGHKP